MSIFINCLSSEEKKEFLIYLQTRNKSLVSPNIKYVRAIYKGETEHSIKDELYASNDAAFRALKKRVADALIDFIAENTFKNEISEDLETIKYLSVSQRLFKQGLTKHGFKILKKAELKALEIDQYTILSEVYHSYITYAPLKESPYTLDDLLVLIEENQKKLLVEERFNLVSSYLKIKLKNYNEGILEDLLSDAFNKFDVSVDDVFSYRSLHSLSQIINYGALVTNDYHSAALFLENSLIQTIASKTYHSRYDERLGDIYFVLAKLYFRSKAFKKSNQFVEKSLKYANNINRDRIHKLLVLKAQNLNYLNKPNEAIELLEEVINNAKKWSDDLLHVNLSLIVFHFQQGNFKAVAKLFAHFYRTEKYYENQMGVNWTASKSLIEILLHIELENIDYVAARIKSFKRRYKKYLSVIDDGNPVVYLQFIEHYLNNPQDTTTDKFKQKVEASFSWENEAAFDVFQIAFYAWLKAKMENISLYDMTLQLVNN